MSLFSAIQGMGNGVENPYILQMQQKLQATQAAKAAKISPVEITPVSINKIHGSESFSKVLETRANPSIERPTFSEMVERGVDHVDAKQKYANNQVRMLMTGESDNLHHAMLSMEESGVSFNLMMETRNKLMDAYQELMRMRV